MNWIMGVVRRELRRWISPQLACVLTACSAQKQTHSAPALTNAHDTSTAEPAPSVVATTPAGPSAGAADSTFAHVDARGDSSCFSDEGCPFAGRSLPPCSREVVEASREPRQKSNAGSAVIVAGLLSPRGMTTNVSCTPGCCNKADGELSLDASGEVFGLWDLEHPDAFRCSGDESRMCCGFDTSPGIEVVATGTLATAVARGGPRPRDISFDILRPALCARGPQASPSGCIRNGYAYRDGVSVPTSRSCLAEKCVDHAWQTVGQECFVELGIVKFTKNGVVIDEKVGVPPAELASRLKVTGGRFEIQGHADTTEKDPLPLSERRARAVRDRLVRLGIAPESLSTRGLGASAPRLEPTPRYLDAFNARVELVSVH